MPDTTNARPWPDDWDRTLDTAIRAEGGEWTTRRVQRLYTATYGRGLFRQHARDCLSQRAHAGLLRLDDQDANRRHFTLNTRKDVRS